MAFRKLRSFLFDHSTRDKRTIFFWFLGICVGTMALLLVFYDPLKKVLDCWFGEGFYIGILSAFAENFVFFGTIGLIAQFVSMKSPEDEEFERRIEAVANASLVSRGAKSYLIEANRKLLAFNHLSQVTLYIEEIREESRAFKVHTDFNNRIVNMCKDVEYSLKNTPAQAEGELLVDGAYGAVTILSLLDETTHQRIDVIDGRPTVLTSGGKKFKEVIPNLNISANSSALWRFSFWLWGKMDNDRNKDDEWYNIILTRFTNNFCLRVKNETQYKIIFDVRYPQREENGQCELLEVKDKELLPGDTVAFDNIILYPLDRFQLFFSNFVSIIDVKK